MNKEQTLLLQMALARPDLILATAADSPNDIVWMELVEQGVLDIVDRDDPDWQDMKAHHLNLRGYRATPKALASFKHLHPTTYADMNAGGTA